MGLDDRPVALVTGVGRRAGIGAAVAERLAADGFDVAITWWSPYDRRMPWGADDATAPSVEGHLAGLGARCLAVEIDLESVDAAEQVFEAVERELAPVTVLVMCHCESVDSGLDDTTVDSFDRHMAVNARAVWLLVREFARRFPRDPDGGPPSGRIVAFTSDHTVGNLPYGASKGALDRIVLAAARELSGRGITANVVNPGATDTGWMSEDLFDEVAAATPLGRVGTPVDAANLVSFLCSSQGGWVNGQLLTSNGGLGTG